MSVASHMMTLVAFGIQVAVCSVGLLIYLRSVKENHHYKTRQSRIKK
jgi:hypothetical protein